MNMLYSFQINSTNSEYGGIIRKIQNITNTIVIKNSIIKLRTSSYDSAYPPERIYQNTSYFRSLEKYVENQWLELDFRSSQVKLEAIYIHLGFCDLFKSYTIYGTQSGGYEEEIGKVKIDIPSQINCTNTNYTLPINSNKYYNIFRIKGDGRRCGWDDLRIVFHGFDMFGTYKVYQIQTQQNNLKLLKLKIYAMTFIMIK